ncbi:MAG: putative enoyl-CoA hydratase, partial [Acidimicrobiales bacterium]|nr:putative enoyl-CoA hydratase [Acidimicrobiales bacterium]
MADANEELVLLERRVDGVAVITLNNPKVNALSQELLARLAAVAAELAADLPGAVVVT